MTNEVTAAMPAVWPAVTMCPVVQKEIAKISAVPISRHVTAFAIVLRIRMLSSACHWPESGRPSRVVRCEGISARSVELRRRAGPLTEGGPHAAQLLTILIDTIL